MITVRIGPKDLGKYEKALGTKLPGVLKSGVLDGAKRAVVLLQALSPQVAGAFTGAFNRGWVAVAVPHGAAVRNKAKHAPFVEFGRAPGKAPPISAIEPWVQKVLSVPPPRSRQVAFLVAKSIGKRGIRPRPVMTAPGMTARMTKIVNDRLMAALDKALAESARG